MGKAKVVIHSSAEVAGIRRAAAKAAWVRDRLCDHVRPGLTTKELDTIAADLIAQTGGESAFLGYHGFPGQICISVNDEVVHGIGRDTRVIQPGDVVSLDVGVRFKGYIGDTARTVCAGDTPTPETVRLMQATEAALMAGIEQACGGQVVNDISTAVEAVAARAGFGVVRDFVGHGCGCSLHEPPEVPNFAQKQPGPTLRPGMVLAIEPMVNAGTYRVSLDRGDGWTVRTADGSLSAHFEHMVLIQKEKPEILTWPKTTSE